MIGSFLALAAAAVMGTADLSKKETLICAGRVHKVRSLLNGVLGQK